MGSINKITKYQQIQEYIKKRIQTKKYPMGSYLPSENEFSAQFCTTRTTVRKALDELLKQGFIEKEHGKGSRVLDRVKSLGLMSIKGFSGSTNYPVKTKITIEPKICDWGPSIVFPLSEEEKESRCVYFQRVRYIDNQPIVLENNWYALIALEPIKSEEFVEGSFFKTLSQDYLIEIIGVEQELRAVPATPEIAKNLNLPLGEPVLHISVKFQTSKLNLYLYGDLYCNTSKYPIRSSYSP
jgi:DNA-binding GntR family transcriptional regulator